jgi:hypothetical protein
VNNERKVVKKFSCFNIQPSTNLVGENYNPHPAAGFYDIQELAEECIPDEDNNQEKQQGLPTIGPHHV